MLGIGCEASVPVGSFCGTGMHGGYIFIRGDEPPRGLPVQVCCETATDEDKKIIKEYVEEFCTHFGYDAKELLASRFFKLTPNTASPYKQLYTNN